MEIWTTKPWIRWGFKLARGSDKATVVFPSHATLDGLRRRLREYAQMVPKGHKYAYLDSIEAILELGPEDRVGSRLKEHPLGHNETAALDIELWHSGNRLQCKERIRGLERFLEGHNLRLTDSYVGASLFLVRARINSVVLEELLTADYVKEIDRRPAPTFEMSDVFRLELPQLLSVSPEQVASEDLVGVVIIDSGIMQGHPLLGPSLGDAQVFPDSLRQRISGGGEDGDESQGGHGTAVAGIAVYSDVGECIERRSFTPSALLFSARVTDNNNQYDEGELVEHQLEQAVRYFLDNYPQVKVINVSLGDDRLVYSDANYQFRLAAAVDELAYRHRNRNVVFVVSAGNFWPNHLSDEQVLEQYPKYLTSSEEARVIDPATSAIALTVGGLSYGEGRSITNATANSTNRLIAGERGWPSPFTRTGWGVGGSVKPDVVDFAGDMRFERGRVPGHHPAYSGLPTTAKAFAPPEGRLFRTVSGTSYAAPRVANLAARLFRDLPQASSNLIRALIADSARVPDGRPEYFRNRETWEEDLLRTYGYGHPDYSRARWSSENEVLLIAEGSIELDNFLVYSVPSLPEQFLATSGCGYISVTLAFDPPTRHTRMDNYLGNTMDFHLFRNVTPENVADAIRSTNSAEGILTDVSEDDDRPANEDHRTLGSFNGSDRVSLKPGVNRRRKGTLQRAVAKVHNMNWRYDNGPLYLAVICQRSKWVPVDVTHQRFAIVVSLYHEDPAVDIYTHVSQQVRVAQRVRVRA